MEEIRKWKNGIHLQAEIATLSHLKQMRLVRISSRRCALCVTFEGLLREATERERKAAISAHNLGAFVEVDFEKLLDDDVFPYVTARMI